MAYDPNNIFARILRGELPCIRLYEDDQTLSFMDIMPQLPGHALVIPKEPAVTIYELSDESMAACLRTAKKVGKALEQAFGFNGTSLFQLNGTEAGQTVPHVHFHVLPGAFLQSKALKGHAAEMADLAELEILAARVRSFL
ncbi:HIT family protein [Parathalassolituus penaei]|uniref:HIT family protein n=1 Tax=Parathalassolituus penaei TaxID=2997323 RepID=A0A9X3IV17_9GAMM|nr:HIT family protein [Parathalassolituus penaei]MCY0966773.1 HIT family protein [Parathalassolituus penaei]